jgi:hypothetical protein
VVFRLLGCRLRIDSGSNALAAVGDPVRPCQNVLSRSLDGGLASYIPVGIRSVSCDSGSFPLAPGFVFKRLYSLRGQESGFASIKTTGSLMGEHFTNVSGPASLRATMRRRVRMRARLVLGPNSNPRHQCAGKLRC